MVGLNAKPAVWEVPGAVENGILPISWEPWQSRWIHGGIYLFLEGAAAVESIERGSGLRGDSLGRGIIDHYLRQGAGFLNSLRGSFALVLWDSRSEQLIVASDPFGTRSIYYWSENGRFAVAPRVACLARASDFRPIIDPNSIYFFLNHSFVSAPRTIYQNVHRLEPGHRLLWGRGNVEVRKYWDMDYGEDRQMTESKAAADLRDSLADSVRFSATQGNWDQTEIGAFLSGGTDSSTLVGLLSKINGRTKSFSVGFDESAYNEIEYARIAAKHFNCDAHEYFVKPAEALDAVQTIGAVYDEPFGNSSAIPTFFCLKMARQAGVKVMLAGDGGDELFGGNERYITEKVFTLYQKLPGVIRGLLDRGVERLPSFYPWSKVQSYVRKANLSPVERFFAYQLYFRDHAAEFLTDEFAESLDREFPLEVPKRHYANAGNIAPLNRLLYVDLKLAIADNDLFKVNRVAEANGVQVLYPYLDPLVGSVSGRIPAGLKIKGWSKRYIFKKAFDNLLPEEILKKKKHGFGLPTGDWLRHHKGFRELARSLLLDPRSLQRGYFQKSALERLLRMHDQESSSYYGSHIWNLMMLELWHRNHADGRR